MDHNVLKDFLIKHQTEVTDLFLDNYDEEKVRQVLMEDAREEGWEKGHAEGREAGLEEGRAEGRAEGRTEGKAEGIAERTLRTIRNQLRRHADYDIIASDNDVTVEEVIRIAKESGMAY